MNKPIKNTQYKIGENLYIQHYTNGSFAFLNSRGVWVNIPPHELGEKLYQLKQELNKPILETEIQECIKNKTHLISCDNDGYCNECGYQEC